MPDKTPRQYTLRTAFLFTVVCTALVMATSAVCSQNPTTTINVDAGLNRHPINPNIYGVAHATSAALWDLNAPLNRNGGNNTSRYNWQLNADNRGNDWYYQSIGEPSSAGGERGDTFISNSKASGAQAMLTIPMIGWVARLGANRSKLASFSIARYGQQTGNDWQWFPDAGNGIWSNGQPVTGNDPNDANVISDSTFQQGWAQHLLTRWGTAANGGLRYYILDNEPSIWHSTHRDVHPTGATMDEIRDRILDYSGKIKAADPSALVAGPEEWGWSGYIFSGYDQQYGSRHGWSFLPDRNSHGGADYLPWLLDQLRQNNAGTGRRLLDIFTVHYYPQGGEFSNDTSAAMQLRRNRSTRSLWDPNYTDESWINDKVRLVPRLRSWVNSYYPGTLTGITEYNWGAEGHINGATAQADILGIFGREGLDMAARWTTPDAATPTYKSMKMYRNYDGDKSAFGDISVAASVPDPDNVSAFAALRSGDGALTVMVINKQLSASSSTTINLANFPNGGTAQVWQLTSSNTIARLPDLSFAGSSFNITLAPQSITLFVLPSGNNNQPPSALASATPSSGVAPLAVAFDGSGSSDPDGVIVSHAWDFGDAAAGSGAAVDHTYSNPGTYSARLTVTDDRGMTASSTVTVIVDPGIPTAPNNLRATAASASKINLAWSDNSTNEEGFRMERCAGAGCTNFTQIATLGANVRSFSNKGLTGNTTYRYRVRAYNRTGDSLYSNTASAKTSR
ncbi:MAG TPA: glycoside hydrolase family 44 protein [Blastocatellia bacterium]|nr:glycoside hydrolase family 44 protein [Blastocatellia bacterium]